MSKDKILTSTQAAKQLGFARDYVRRLCANGIVKAEKLGKTWVINAKDLKKVKRRRFPKETEDATGSE